MGVPGGYGGFILFCPFRHEVSKRVPDCGSVAVPGRWMFGVCGNDVDVWMTAKKGFYCLCATGELVHERWIDWDNTDPVPDGWS